MPIYAYRCARCGFEKDVLQKMSDPLLVTCPSCGEPALEKQVTAAGFQLKGSGWYVTDFRNPATKEAKKTDKAEGGESGALATQEGAAPAASDAPPAPAPPSGGGESAKASAPTATPAPAPAATKTPPSKSSSGDGR